MPIQFENQIRDHSSHCDTVNVRLSWPGTLVAVVLLISSSTLPGQDMRKGTEPHIPAACATLDASIAADQGVILPEDERKLDTERIQRAIDNCGAGKAEVMSKSGKRNVLLAAPITLRSGVTLVLDANTALVASRDPRV
jgi:polygalacturonase